MTTPGAGPRDAATSDTGGAASHSPAAGPAPESDRIAQIRENLAEGWFVGAAAARDLLAEVDRLTTEVQTVKGEAFARVGELAAQRAAVLALCETADQSWRAAHGAAGTATVGVRAVREALGAS